MYGSIVPVNAPDIFPVMPEESRSRLQVDRRARATVACIAAGGALLLDATAERDPGEQARIGFFGAARMADAVAYPGRRLTAVGCIDTAAGCARGFIDNIRRSAP